MSKGNQTKFVTIRTNNPAAGGRKLLIISVYFHTQMFKKSAISDVSIMKVSNIT